MSNLIWFFLALLFVPGILGAFIDAISTPGFWPKFSYFLASSFLFGIFSYLATGILYIVLSNFDWFKLQFDILSLIDIALANYDGNVENAKVVVARELLDDVLMSMLISIGLGVVWIRVKYTKWLAILFTTKKVVFENTQNVQQTGRESSLRLDTYSREGTREFKMVKDNNKELSWPIRTPLPGVYVRRITTAHIKRERSPLLRPLKQEPPKNDENKN